MQPAIFLDRDGVIIENRADYIRCWADVVFYPQALQALAEIQASPYRIIIITNQAGIGHGLIQRTIADEINYKLVKSIEAAGGRIDGVYMCPHTPDDGCNCRKPRPGLLLQAANDLQINMAGSVLIGDNLSDLLAGRSAGVGQVILVRTGLGNEQISRLASAGLKSVPVFNTLAQALENLVHAL
jgi:D-glycero-D-manno-heptose 1,7-bisphosphate phosphatase